MSLLVNCDECSKLINFEHYDTLDEVKLFNWNNENGQNVTSTFCSNKCLKDSLAPSNMFCVICNTVCSEKKWFVECKFVKIGNWLSVKSVCSENCRQVILDRDTSDIELKKVCCYCKSLKDTMKICGKCKIAYYCDINCQKSHWKIHKPNCN